jgi:putative oxidoreductase
MLLYDHPYSTLIGRILLGAIFLLSGINKIADPAGTQGYMAAMGMTWATMLFYVGAVILEIGGGLSICLGYWTRVGAALLIGFMIPTTLIFHTNFSDPNQMIHFMKNLAMTGGLLYLVSYGPGPLSLDPRLSREAGTGADEQAVRMRRRASA